MTRHFILSLFILGFSGPFSYAHAEENSRAIAAKIEILDDAALEKIEKSTELTEHHHLLSSLAGNWYYEMHFWLDSDAGPQISTGTMMNEMVLGKRILQSKTNLILNIGGQNIPYEGQGILGYDPSKQQFISQWADTLHAGMISGFGKYNESKNVIEEKGVFISPFTQKEQSYRSELQLPDGGSYKKSIFITDKSGKEYKAIEILFERRQ